MYPILIAIPLPHSALKLWWALAAVAAIAAIYGALGFRKNEKTTGQIGFGIAVAAGIAAYVFREKSWQATSLPIYSYGVMLGLSLVVGWYLTLGLADREGLPKEAMANCYVITAVVALIGSRLLYVATNLDQFKSIGDVLAIRSGGYVAYGGFLGGFLGSWLYLRSQNLKLLPWADVAVPSLASGLMITRIGCYLYGCDYGTRLPAGAPGFLSKLGTFPHWTGKALAAGEGSKPFVEHTKTFKGSALGAELMKTNHSLPVHPTQLYESLVGLGLLGLLFWQRKSKRFDGQLFYLFVFSYGAIRFMLEFIRDDDERGTWGPEMALHLLVPSALIFFAVAFAFGISLGITNMRTRSIARGAAFLPAVVSYFLLAPAKFGGTHNVHLSTSQVLGLVTSGLAAFFFARGWVEAATAGDKASKRKRKIAATVEDIEDEEDDEEEEEEAPKVKAGAAKASSKKASDAEKSSSSGKAAAKSTEAKTKKADDDDTANEDDESDSADDDEKDPKPA